MKKRNELLIIILYYKFDSTRFKKFNINYIFYHPYKTYNKAFYILVIGIFGENMVYLNSFDQLLKY